MRKNIRIISAFFLTIFFTSLHSADTPKLTEEQALALGTEAYIYAYPLVTMEMTRRVMTNIPAATDEKAPMGQFANMREYPDPSFQEVTAPNADTLYSIAWLDLSKEPYILHVPSEKDRYYLMPLLDAWTDVIASPGTRTLGNKSADYIIVGPNWKGMLPRRMKKINSPTNLVWVLGRTYSTGTPEDYTAVHAIQDEYTLTPLSAYEKKRTPVSQKVDRNVDMATPVRKQVNQMDAATYFKMFAELLKNNPPAAEDAPMIATLSQLGIVVGQSFDINKLDPDVKKGLEKSVKQGQEKILAHRKQAGIQKNGWITFAKTGSYGTDYLDRAFITFVGLGANLPQDAVYPEGRLDSEGNVLNGANQYVLHFEKNQIPPVRGFWSITMYDSNYYFVNNSLKRYAISPRNSLKYNEDGSLDLYIQQTSPGSDKESNWLPSPAGDFLLMMRLYWPEPSIINGSWEPPPIQKVN
jgi:hypothetical protein